MESLANSARISGAVFPRFLFHIIVIYLSSFLVVTRGLPSRFFVSFWPASWDKMHQNFGFNQALVNGLTNYDFGFSELDQIQKNIISYIKFVFDQYKNENKLNYFSPIKNNKNKINNKNPLFQQQKEDNYASWDKMHHA